MKKKADPFKEIVIKVDKLPQQVLDQVGEMSERIAEVVVKNEAQLLRHELRRSEERRVGKECRL